jgi:phosphoribosylformylglycinamidine synthase
MWQFRRCIEGMAEACRVLETPVTGGNVSFYNETMDTPIFPTPVVGMLGFIENIEKRMTAGFKKAGHVILLAGETREELGASEYLKLVTGEIRGLPPALDLEREKALQAFVLQAIRLGLVSSAHDCAEGGLAVALAECAFLAGPGAAGAEVDVNITAGATVAAGMKAAAASREPAGRLDATLFGESQSRVLISCDETKVEALFELAQEHGVPLARLGLVRDGRFTLKAAKQTLIDEETDALKTIWHEALPKALSG